MFEEEIQRKRIFKKETTSGGVCEIKSLPEMLCTAFLQGAKFWEYRQTGFTMWQSDQNICMERAAQKLKTGSLGKDEAIEVKEND